MVPFPALRKLLDGSFYAMPPLRYAHHRPILEEFLYLMLVHRAKPTLLIRCQREAYQGLDTTSDARLTLDRELCVSHTGIRFYM